MFTIRIINAMTVTERTANAEAINAWRAARREADAKDEARLAIICERAGRSHCGKLACVRCKGK